MKDNLDIEKLFKEKFESFNPQVDAQVWQNIAGATAAKAGVTASAGTALWVKSLVIGAVAATVGIGAWFYIDGQNKTIEHRTEKNVSENSKAVTETSIVKTDNIAQESSDLEAEIKGESIALKNSDPIGTQTVKLSKEKASKQTKSVDNNNLIVDNTIKKTSTTTTTPNVEAERVVENETPIKEDNNSSEGNVVEKNKPVEPATDVKTSKDSYTEAELPKEVLIEKSSFEEIPNVFTPDNDRINDLFFINSENIKEFYIVIYSRENIKLFESTDPKFKWDGYDMFGNKVLDGVYYYLVKAEGLDGKAHSIAGQVNIR